MTRKSLSSIVCLDRRKALKFALIHMNLLSTRESNRPRRTSDKADTIAIQTLVNATDAARRACNGHTGTLALDFRLELLLVTLTEELDDGSLHGKLDTVQRQEPNKVPYPDDTDPATRDAGNLSEWPVTIGSDDGRDELGNAEGDEERPRWPFHEEEAVRTGDEDECL